MTKIPSFKTLKPYWAAGHRFFGALFQRAAKLHRRKGGGSLTMLLVLPGLPARGEAAGAGSRALALDPEAKTYQHLSEPQRAKLAAALAARAASGDAARSAGAQPDGCVRTEARLQSGALCIIPDHVQRWC